MLPVRYHHHVDAFDDNGIATIPNVANPLPEDTINESTLLTHENNVKQMKAEYMITLFTQ